MVYIKRQSKYFFSSHTLLFYVSIKIFLPMQAMIPVGFPFSQFNCTISKFKHNTKFSNTSN